jgi:hypothetical protein
LRYLPLGPYQVDDTDDGYYSYAQPVPGQAHTYAITAYAQADGVRRQASMTVRFTSVYRQAVMAANPTAYWRLGETWGWRARDSAGDYDGRYRNGVDRGETGGLPHDSNTAADFDGVNDYVELDDDLDFDHDSVTFAAWFRVEAWDRDDGRIISRADGTGEQDHYWMLSTCQRGGEYRLRFRLRINGHTRELVADGGSGIEAGEWVFAAATYDGHDMRLYKDGKPVGEKHKSGHVDDDDDVEAWIGGNPDGETSRPWNGRIDEVAIFRRALSGEEIEGLYRSRLPEVEILSWQD